MSRDLRSFIGDLRSEAPSDLLEIKAQVNPAAFDCVAILEKLELRNEFPMAVFENPLNLRGEPSEIRLAMNTFASRGRCATALDFPPERSNLPLSLEFSGRANEKIPPVLVASSESPIKDVIVTGSNVDTRDLPIVTHSEGDYGPCLTMTMAIRDPESGAYNLAFIKGFYDREDHARLRITINSPDTKRALRWYEERGQDMPMVAILGHHPAFYLGTLGFTPYESDDYETVGAYLGEPLRLVPSETWGDDFLIPADAEIVIEGTVPAGVRMICDPFGDITRQYQAQGLHPVMNVSTISRRSDAILQDIFSGHRDHMTVGQIPKEGSLFANLRREFGDVVTSVHFPYSGCGRLACYISIKKTQEGQAKAVALAAARESWTLQYVVVVDDYIDVFREEDVIWAMMVYADPTRDIDSIKNVWTIFTLAMGDRKVLIDATRALDVYLPEMNRVPRAALERVDLDSLLDLPR